MEYEKITWIAVIQLLFTHFQSKMNIMRKWWGSGPRVGGVLEGVDAVSSQAQQQHLALGLMHLKKLFSEYTYPPHPLTDTEKEDKLYNMLPLFCKVNYKY